MNARSVVHYFRHDTLFDIPQYCRPLLSPRYATLNPKEVTCKGCLTKMRRNGQPTERTAYENEPTAPR